MDEALIDAEEVNVHLQRANDIEVESDGDDDEEFYATVESGSAATTVGQEDEVEREKPVGELKALLLGAPRDLWAVVVMVFLESLAYFSLTFVLILMLEREYGMDDVDASTTYALFGVVISLYAVFFGWIVDWLRVRKALLLHTGLCLVSKLALGLLPSTVTMWIVLMGPLSFTLSIGSTAVLAAIRRYTTSETRNVAFAVQYIAMNVGALVSEPLTDVVRVSMVPAFEEMGLRGYSWFVAMTGVLHALALLTVFAFVRDVCVDRATLERPNTDPTPVRTRAIATSDDSGAYVSFKARPRKWPLIEYERPQATTYLSDGRACSRGWLRGKCQAVKGACTFKLLGFVILSFGTMGAKSVFRYLDSLYPLWMSRAAFPVEDPSKVPFNTFLMINPIIVILFTAALASFMQRRKWHPYYVILVGTTISALAPFWMMITEYFAVVFFVTQLSIGEITWSPMLSTYSCWFAPDGQEGLFFALATLPIFGAKAAAGYMSGKVLKTYCPPSVAFVNATTTTTVMAAANATLSLGIFQASCSPMVWLIVGALAVSSPIIILLFMKCIKIDSPETEARLDDDIIMETMSFHDIQMESDDSADSGSAVTTDAEL